MSGVDWWQSLGKGPLVLEYLEAQYRTIVAVDVAQFTAHKRRVVHQVAIHGGLESLLRGAFDDAGIAWKSCDVEDRGDGKLILVLADVPKIRLVDQLWSRLLAGLRRYNAIHSDATTIQLRVALHAGEVRWSPKGKVSAAINFAFRILEAQDAKAALARSGDVLALIASDQFYRDVIEPDPAAAPDLFQQIAVQVKETTAVAWMRLPEARVSAGALPGTEPNSANVLDLLPPNEVSRLRVCLRGVSVPRLPQIVSRAAGPGVPPAPPGATAWEAFEHLIDFNADADGFPPALLFVELLIHQVDQELAGILAQWSTDQARRLRLDTELTRRRATIAQPSDLGSRLHLLIAVQRDGIDQNLCHLSYWRQDDPTAWPPARSEIVTVTLDELEHRVDELVVSAEDAWERHDGTAALEILLPRALLGLPVHAWHKEHASGDPRPLFLEYPIVVRSLERMATRYWHRNWRRRWRVLMADPTTALVHIAQPTDPHKPHAIGALLEQELRFAAVVLPEPPSVDPQPGDQLNAALRSGLPAVLWRRNGGETDGVRELLGWLTDAGGLADLPARTQIVRRNAYLDSSAGSDVARDLVLMWDNPARPLEIDDLVS